MKAKIYCKAFNLNVGRRTDTITIPPASKKCRKKRSKAVTRKTICEVGSKTAKHRATTDRLSSTVVLDATNCSIKKASEAEITPKIRSVPKSAIKTLIVRQSHFKPTVVSEFVTKKRNSAKREVKRKVSLNIQPNNIQYDLSEEEKIMEVMAQSEVPKKPLVKNKILVYAPSRFATSISNIELHDNSDTSIANQNDFTENRDLSQVQSPKTLNMIPSGPDRVNVPLISVNVKPSSQDDTQEVDFSANSKTVGHGNVQNYEIGDIIDLDGVSDDLNSNIDGNTKMILQEISGLGRKVDGTALQNAQIIVQVEDLRKCFKDNMMSANSYDDWELHNVIPVKSPEELIDLGPRISKDEEFHKIMFRYLRNFKGKPDVENPITDHYGSVLQRIASDKVIDEFNYGGIKGKIKLKNHPIVDLIFDIYKPMDKKLFIKRFKMTLHYAKQRVYNEKFRNKEKNDRGEN